MMKSVLVFFRFMQTVASGGCISLTGCTLRTSSPLNLNSIYQYKTKQRWASSCLLMCRSICFYRVLIVSVFSTAVTADGILPSLFYLHTFMSDGFLFVVFQVLLWICVIGFICWINILYAQSEPRCLPDYFTFMHFIHTFIQSEIQEEQSNSLQILSHHISYKTRYADVWKDLLNWNMSCKNRTRKT